jgi:hypothetical protein
VAELSTDAVDAEGGSTDSGVGVGKGGVDGRLTGVRGDGVETGSARGGDGNREATGGTGARAGGGTTSGAGVTTLIKVTGNTGDKDARLRPACNHHSAARCTTTTAASTPPRERPCKLPAFMARDGNSRPQSGLMLPSFTTRLHKAISLLSSLSSSAGVEDTGNKPRRKKRSRTSGRCNSAATA